MMSILNSLLKAFATACFVIGGIAFLFGGVVIYIVAKTDRVLAEMGGIGLTVLFFIIGALAQFTADRLDEGAVDPNGPTSLRQALRK
jgi:hypothetical protein